MSTAPKPPLPITPSGNVDWTKVSSTIAPARPVLVGGSSKAAPSQAKPNKVQQTPPELLMPEEVLYGKLGDAARSLSVPLGPGYFSLLTIFAGMFGMGVDRDQRIRPTLYTVILGPPGSCKSQSINQAFETLRPPIESYSTSVPGSDIGLYNIFAPEEDAADTQQVTSSVLLQDEMRSMMQKMGIQGSTLAPMVCTLWSKDEVGSASKRGHNRIRKRLSILGGLAVNDPGDFKTTFSKVTGDGLYDRCIFVPVPLGWKGDFSWRAKPLMTPPIPSDFNQGEITTQTTPEMFNRLEAWRDSDPEKAVERGRLMEIGCRVALLSSMANGDAEVTEGAIVAAEHFVAWQARVRSHYAAGVAENTEALVTDLILSAMAEPKYVNPDGTPKKVKLNELLRNRNFAKSYGGPLVSKVRKSLIDDGYIFQEKYLDENDRSRPTGWYWLLGGCSEVAE